MMIVMMIKCSPILIDFAVYLPYQRIITAQKMMKVIKREPVDSHVHDKSPRQVKGDKIKMHQGLR